ncbi:hypothetical protein D3C87_588440 [compost metagenome]
MRYAEILRLFEDGKVVKGVNTTVDVGTDEIKTQAKKFGNTVSTHGVPDNDMWRSVKKPKGRS